MANHVVLAAESRAAKLAIETRRNANALIAHVPLQVALAQVTLVADGAAAIVGSSASHTGPTISAGASSTAATTHLLQTSQTSAGLVVQRTAN